MDQWLEMRLLAPFMCQITETVRWYVLYCMYKPIEPKLNNLSWHDWRRSISSMIIHNFLTWICEWNLISLYIRRHASPRPFYSQTFLHIIYRSFNRTFDRNQSPKVGWGLAIISSLASIVWQRFYRFLPPTFYVRFSFIGSSHAITMI